ncbi:TPR repeat region-containing protein [Nocardia sp. CDC160]|uniref:TPR repeat region-containing protein n=1 Tax=Nocardia sp. CDC160 TaxID=3112166 RepID=UPI002DBFF2C3|nr:hypothetical protein [Nocardia sp. CDC160]MEC3915220.1 hypothetical protein [Nocardia sp. CDC160]
MGTPSKSQVLLWNLQAFADVAADADKITSAIDDRADTMHRTIHDLRWSGAANRAATGRADREKQQIRAVATAYFHLAEACRDVFALQPTVTDLQNRVRALEGGGEFRVDEDWTVHAADKKNDDEATNSTITLQAMAKHLGEEDDRLGPVITAAVAEISKLAPTTSTLTIPPAFSDLSEQTAKKDLQAFEDGTATDEQIARLKFATNLSPEQKEKLQRGEPIDVPREQFDYVRGLMRGQDGMYLDQIENIGSRLPADKANQVHAAMADAMQIVSNPGINAPGGNQGGMQQLPSHVRELLTENPLHNSLGGPWVDKNGFTSVTNIVNRGDPSLRLGTDLDRGMLKQASEITKIADRYTDENHWMDGVGGVADKMLGAAGPDHAAVSDFITGHGMNATVTHGGTYNADEHVMSVLSHGWSKDEHGAENLFKWIGGPEAVPDPQHPWIAERAGHTADALAQMLVRNEDHLASNLPGHDGASLGKVNPGLTQSLSEAMRPYLGNFVAAPDNMLVNHSAHSFESVSDLSKLFTVLDSDPTASKIINSAGSQWQDYLAYQAGLHPDQGSSLGFRAGQLSVAMKEGFQNQLQLLNTENQWDYTQRYNQHTALSDAASGWFGALPGVGTVAGPLASSANAWFKLEGLSVPGDPQHPLPPDKMTQQLQASAEKLTNPDTLRRQFSLLSGYAQNHQDIVPTFDQPPGADGSPAPNLLQDWNAAVDKKNQFNDLYRAVDKASGNDIGRYEDGFKDGLSDNNIITAGAKPEGSSGPVR